MAEQDKGQDGAKHTIGQLAAAFGRKDIKPFLREIIDFGSREFRECEPGAEAIFKYLRSDRALSYSFALLLLEFIDSKDDHLRDMVPAEVRARLEEKVSDPARALQRCLRLPSSDALGRLIDKAPGVYVTIRPDTGQKFMVQDVLVLGAASMAGKEGYAIFVGADLVSRGRWCVVRNLLHVSLSGHRSHSRSDMVNFAVDFDTDEDLYVGALLGASTDSSHPAFVPVILTRMPEHLLGKSIQQYLTTTDSRLARRFPKLHRTMPADSSVTELVTTFMFEMVRGRTEKTRDGSFIEKTTGFMSMLRASNLRPEDFVLEELRNFLSLDRL